MRAPLDRINNSKWTALIEAIVLGDGGSNHTVCIRMLIEAGVNLNIAGGEGTTQLGLAQQVETRK